MASKSCTSAGIWGAIQAHASIDDGPIFDYKNINSASFRAQLSFSKALNRLEGKQVDVNIEKFSKVGSAITRLVTKGVRTPEAILPKQVWARVDRRMTQWGAYYKRSMLPKIQQIEKKYEKFAENLQKSKAPDKADKLQALEVRKQKELAPIRLQAEKSYKEMVGKQFKTANQQIQDVYNQFAEQPKRLDAELKKMGLTRQDAYYTHQYLKHLENGGPFFNFNPGSGSKAGEEIAQELVSTVTGKKISFDPKQVVYNTSEFVQKAPAVAGFKNALGGIVDAQKAAHKAKLTIFDRLPELERQGIYHNDYSALRPQGKYDTTAKTQNMLDNLAYYAGKRMGDVQKAMTGIAYRPKPWNDTFAMMTGMKPHFSFMSFQFRHMQQYGGWMKQALSGDKQAIRSLAIYSAMTGLIFGDRAAIPAPVYWLVKGVDPKLDEHIKEFQNEIPIVGGLLNDGIFGESVKLATGGMLEADMTKYVQPFGGVAIGVGTDMVQGSVDAATRTIPKALKEIREGRSDKAVAIAINGITQLSQLHQNGANAFVQKTIDAVTKAYLEDEFTTEGLSKHLGQKYLGKEAVK